MKIWADLDNAPHVHYILPVALAFKDMGGSVCFTARDRGQVVELLQLKGVESKVIGKGFPKSRGSKILYTIWRACQLALVMEKKRPDICLSNSRAAALASRFLSIKSFTFCDFENSELRSYQLLGSYLIFPDVIPAYVFQRMGFKQVKLIPYPGLKENITLDGFSIPKSCPLPSLDLTKTIILLRPPSSISHYHKQLTSDLFRTLEEYLLERIGSSNLQIVISPRDSKQRLEYGSKYRGEDRVLVLEKSVDGLNLIWYSDLVISAGGTMIREAACLGSRAYSLLKTKSGAVDQHLESIGKLVFIRSAEDFSKLRLSKVEMRQFNPENYQGFASGLALMIMKRTWSR